MKNLIIFPCLIFLQKFLQGVSPKIYQNLFQISNFFFNERILDSKHKVLSFGDTFILQNVFEQYIST